jgi:predicted nuclease with TOPRIM domain
MSDSCSDIDAALARLGGKIDGLNRKLDDLEKEQKRCCQDKDKDKGKDSGLEKRVSDLEEIVKKIAKYVNEFDEAVKTGTEHLKSIFKLLNLGD